MPRITVDIHDAELIKIDAEAKSLNVSRSKWAANAIDAYLHQKCSISDAEVVQLKDKVMHLQEQLDTKTKECDAQAQHIKPLSDELDRVREQLKRDNIEATQR